MLKLVAIGVWVIIVTAGATFASVYMSSPKQEAGAAHADLGVEEMTSEMTSIPVIRGGDVVGYLLLQLSFGADKAVMEEKKLDPMPFMKDAAFRVVFSRDDVDFRRLRPGDLDKLTQAIAAEVNQRLGKELVRHVLLQQVNYVRKEDIRTNWISGGSGGDGGN